MADPVGIASIKVLLESDDATENLSRMGMTVKQFERSLKALETPEEKRIQRLEQMQNTARALGADSAQLQFIEDRLNAKMRRTNEAMDKRVQLHNRLSTTGGTALNMVAGRLMGGLPGAGAATRLAGAAGIAAGPAAAVLAAGGAQFMAGRAAIGQAQDIQARNFATTGTGMTAAEIRGFGAAGARVGISEQAITNAMRSLNQRLSMIRIGRGDPTGLVRAGLSFEDLRRPRETPEVFMDLLDQLRGIRDPDWRAFLADESGLGRQLLPLLELEERELDRRIKQYEILYSPQNRRAADDLSNSWRELRTNMQFMYELLRTSFIPMFRDIVGFWASITSGRMPSIGEAAGGVFGLGGVGMPAYAAAGAARAVGFGGAGSAESPVARESRMGRPRTEARRERRARTRAMPPPIDSARTGGGSFDPSTASPSELGIMRQEMMEGGIAPFGPRKPRDVFEKRYSDFLQADRETRSGAPLKKAGEI